MKPSRQSSQSTQGGRRGGSRRRSDGPRSSNPSSGPANGSSKTAPTFWQKIASIFTGGRKPTPQKSAPEKVSTHPTTLAAARRASGAGGSNNSNSGTDERPNSSRVVRKPEMVEVTTPRLYVGNLSFDAAENDLTELFKGVGQVASVEVVSHKQTQRSKGFAFVQMQSVEEAKRAVEELHDKEFMGRKLVVSGAKNGDQHDGRSEPRFAA